MRFARLLFVFSLMAGCKNKDRIPQGVLPHDKMQAVLRDMMRADQFLSDYVVSKDSALNKDSVRIEYYKQVFAIHKISKNEFGQSFAWYKNHPAHLQPVMDSISNTKAPVAERPPFKVKDTAALLK
jgi:hypothetical protein